MSKFIIKVLIIYVTSLLIIYKINEGVYWVILITIIVLQLSNSLFRKRIDNVTKYKDPISKESEQISFFYSYFGFPITLIFRKRFREIRKDSYYERKIKEINRLIEFYGENDAEIPENMKNEWVICNRYLKLKKLKTKHQKV